MLRQQAFKFRLNPTPEQQAIMERTAGVVRFVWNSALALQKYRLDRKARILSYAALCKELTEARHVPDLAFLREVHSQPVQQTLKDLTRAFGDFFCGQKGFPRFKKKGQRDSFRQPQSVRVVDRHVHIPGIGSVRFRKSRAVLGVIKNATVSKRGGHWYIAIQTEREVAEATHPSSSETGVDVGIATFATLSTGERYLPVNCLRRMEQRLRLELRRLSRKKKFSKNWRKQKAVVSRLHQQIADARNDHLHKTSTSISKNHAVAYIEDLSVRNMSASARGTIEEPGRNVKQKAGLNKSILDQGWYEFRRQLDYKELWLGGRCVAVPPHYTSQTCSMCLHTHAENRRSQSIFACMVCGYTDNADFNAAKNILRVGRTLSACGSNSKGSRKQEPGKNREVHSLGS